ncbi:hypothetical protein IAU60_004254 [Kwoniella sp. DSM 27419]
MEPPVTLRVVKLSPPSLVPSYIPTGFDLSDIARPLPTLPADFHFSPTANYPTPFGNVTLGSTLALDLELENTHGNREDVLGIRMMVEVQGPSGRYRLGEVIHSTKAAAPGSEAEGTVSEEDREELPALRHGESVKIAVESEMKDLGLNVIIVSAAWETLDGRRTMQRFLKFNVNPPLAIKTRIQIPSHPNAILSRDKREEVYLEVLMQNVSGEGMRLSRVVLEAVQGLKSRAIKRDPVRGVKPDHHDEGDDGENTDNGLRTLLPNDTRQYLFVLSPEPLTTEDQTTRSTFPPTYPSGTILPLGRLDVSWLMGAYHIPGRLQTSTLNRRAPLPPPSAGTAARPPSQMGRTLSSQSQPSNPLATPNREQSRDPMLLAPHPTRGRLGDETRPGWEFDLTLEQSSEGRAAREVEVEQRFKLGFKLAVRSTQAIRSSSSATGHPDGADARPGPGDDDDDDAPLSRRASRVPEHDLPPPPVPKLAVQYLSPVGPGPAQASNGPQLALSPPSRGVTPLSPAPSTSGARDRPFSPLSGNAASSSRPMTPLSSQLRQAQSQGMATTGPSFQTFPVPTTPAGPPTTLLSDIDFPPPPTLTPASPSKLPHLVHHIGNSLLLLPSQPLARVTENAGVTYTASETPASRWESTHTFELDFMAFDEGLSALGGIRVLVLDDAEGGGAAQGFIGREWESLGDLLVYG